MGVGSFAYAAASLMLLYFLKQHYSFFQEKIAAAEI
jgi:hypothetical protein